ncbi:hypothetical protein TNCV_998131 [Trichonephila clavipes]|nr:hypothetical protein TNCV_998131 [Trichonephila clavipes]
MATDLYQNSNQKIVDHYRSCERLTPEVSPSPSYLHKGGGGTKVEPEISTITIVYLLKHTNQQQVILKGSFKGVAERKQ